MRTIWFDPFSGASGDMILGALVDAGAPIDQIREALAALPVGGYTLTAEEVQRGAMRATLARVDVTEDRHSRTWAEIEGILRGSALKPAVRDRALAIFTRLAEAEAHVHGAPVSAVHFHEVGGVDAIVDICGAAIALDLLGIERVICGAPRLGMGITGSMHGPIPVPAPATAELLARAQAPSLPGVPGREEVMVELLTPTGAAILTMIAEFATVPFTPERVGYGAGTKELPWPNLLRAWIGESAGTAAGAGPDGSEWVCETNIDDMNPQGIELLVERLFAAGALDAWVTPIQMKKNRPALTVSAICADASRDAVVGAFITQSTTLGVRCLPVDRRKAARRFETVTTRFGDVQLKVRGWEGRVIDAAPEYDDVARLARESGAPFREVWFDAHRLGEALVGRRIGDDGEWVEGSRR